MKGLKAYTMAQSIQTKMYEYPNQLSEKEKKNLYEEYYKLIKTSAYAGYCVGQYEYGQQFESMNYLALDNPFYNPKKCIFWYSKACKNGYAEACNNLANFYEKGESCKQNLSLALELYKRSANLGSLNGKKNLKLMLRDLRRGGKYNTTVDSL